MTAERPGSMPRAIPDQDLEAALRDLGRAVAVPAARADLASRVTARLQAERPRRATVPWWSVAPSHGRPLRRSILLAAAALLVVAAVVAAAIGWGLPGLRILVGPVATPPPVSPTVPSGEPGATVGLGTPLTLEAAAGLVDFEILLPPGRDFGPPEAVYLSGPRLSLAWADGPGRPGTSVPGLGLLLVEIHAKLDQAMIRKIVDGGTPVQPIAVDGAPGYWISGDSHELLFIDPGGHAVADSRRLAGNTLVWTRDGITYRLEGDFDRDAALALAASLR